MRKVKSETQPLLLNYNDVTFLSSVSLTGIKVGETIGEGHYAIVKKGLWNQQVVALKQWKFSQNIQGFLREVKIINALRHPNIVLFFGVHLTEQEPWIVRNLLFLIDIL